MRRVGEYRIIRCCRKCKKQVDILNCCCRHCGHTDAFKFYYDQKIRCSHAPPWWKFWEDPKWERVPAEGKGP